MRKSFAVLLVLLLTSVYEGMAQRLDSAASQNDTTVYRNVDVYPILVTFDGNYEIKKLKKFIGKHLMWPDPQMDCFGTVIISFVVEVDGSVSDRKYLKRLCPKFDEEAMRVASLMNKWEPGILNGEKVRTKVSIPITYKID